MAADDHYFLSRITGSLPRSLFTRTREEIDAAFFEAYRRTNDQGRYDAPERREVLGRERHWCCERAIRRVAEAAGLSCATPHTQPAGGRYSLISSPDFVIGRAKVDFWTDRVKPSKYRRELAEMNTFVSFSQQDLFCAKASVKKGALFGLVIAAANRHTPEVPAFVRFAIPNDTLTGWVFNKPLEAIIAAYVGVEQPVEIIPDLARVTIKKLPPVS